jgi:transposase-like protein
MPRRYPAETRRQVIELARSGSKSIRELAADLGCTEPTLRSWVA